MKVIDYKKKLEKLFQYKIAIQNKEMIIEHKRIEFLKLQKIIRSTAQEVAQLKKRLYDEI